MDVRCVIALTEKSSERDLFHDSENLFIIKLKSWSFPVSMFLKI